MFKAYQVTSPPERGPVIIDNNALSDRRIEELQRSRDDDFVPMEGFPAVNPDGFGMESSMGGDDVWQEGAESDGFTDFSAESFGQDTFQDDGFVSSDESFDQGVDFGQEEVQEPAPVVPDFDEEAFQAELDARIEEASRQADEIIAGAQAQAETITSMAHEEAESVRKAAEQAGRDAGYEAGLQEGIVQIEQERADLEARGAQMEKDFQQLVDSLEPEMVDVLTQIYEHIFNVDLRENKNIILHLLQTTLARMEGGSNIIIHISSDDYDMVLDEKPRLEETLTNPGTTLEFIEDPLLSTNECILETDGGVFDCSLGVELSELERKLKLLSFERKK